MSATDRLCVASYGEDVAWVARTGIEACVYDATGARGGLIPVANEAREASQYLRHIVAHYGAFRDYELFLQGDPVPHNPGILAALHYRPWQGRRVAPLSRRVLHFDVANTHPHTRWALDFGAEIGVTLSNDSLWPVGAMFAASREALMARPLGWWQRLLAKAIIERERSPWVLERLWLAILA